MRVTILQEGDGLHTIRFKRTRHGEKRVPTVEHVPQKDLGEAVRTAATKMRSEIS